LVILPRSTADGDGTGNDPKTKVVNCKGAMYVPVHNGVKGVPWFKGVHECGWAIPQMLIREPSDRNTLEIVQPSIGGLVSSEERRAIVRTLEGSNIWSRVTGGGIQKTEYAKNLIDDPAALAVVKKAMESYVKQVQEKYPALIHVKYGALRTFPNQELQYSRHGNKLHADYAMDCKDLPPSQRPISIIVALRCIPIYLSPHETCYQKLACQDDNIPETDGNVYGRLLTFRWRKQDKLDGIPAVCISRQPTIGYSAEWGKYL
jgi:hypothetical protein